MLASTEGRRPLVFLHKRKRPLVVINRRGESALLLLLGFRGFEWLRFALSECK